MNPNTEPRHNTKHDPQPERTRRGKLAWASYLRTAPGASDTDDDIMDALWYADKLVALPVGGRKLKAALRAESLRRGLRLL